MRIEVPEGLGERSGRQAWGILRLPITLGLLGSASATGHPWFLAVLRAGELKKRLALLNQPSDPAAPEGLLQQQGTDRTSLTGENTVLGIRKPSQIGRKSLGQGG